MTIKSPILNIMTKAAYKAGNKLLKDFREIENLQVAKKRYWRFRDYSRFKF